MFPIKAAAAPRFRKHFGKTSLAVRPFAAASIFFGSAFMLLTPVIAERLGLAGTSMSHAGAAIDRSSFFAAQCKDGTTYCSRTNLDVVPLPDPIPDVGGLKGANTIVTPSDFHNPIVRITDSQTEGREGGNKAFDVSSSAEAHVINRNDDRFVVSDQGAFIVPFAFNTSTMQAARMYVSSFRTTNGMIFSGRGFPIWSYQQPYVLYLLQSNSRHNPAIMQYDFASTKKPTSPTQLVDLSSCVRDLAGDTNGWVADLTVSDDDQTFATSIAGSNGTQGSAVYLIVWSRKDGCRVWKTDTGEITGTYGGAPTGTVNSTNRFTIHNVRISKDGNWLKVVGQRCLSGDCVTDHTRASFWNIRTPTVNTMRYSTPLSCGHGAAGFLHMVNCCGEKGYASQSFWIRAFTDIDSVKFLDPVEPANHHPFDVHISWGNADSGDAAPFLATTWIGQLRPNYPWDNEIIGVSTDGSAVIHRFAHNFITGQSGFFSSKYGVGSVSQDGRWFIWSSDWAGTLGNVNLRSEKCAVGVDCRADVFMVKLQ